MKKKFLMAMMLCVCVFGLTGCNKAEEKPRTLEVAFKEEQKGEFKNFKDATIKGSQGVVTDVDVVEDKIIIISELEKYQAVIDDEAQKEAFNRPDDIEKMVNSLDGVIEDLDGMMKNYDGNTIITYVFRAPSGDVLLEFSFDKDGLIK